MRGNFGFASILLNTLKKQKNTYSVIHFSTQQASLTRRLGNSECGRSKKAVEEDLSLEYNKETGVKVLSRYISSFVLQLWLALILLFVGGMIYIAFRSTSLVMFSWFNELGMNAIVDSIRRISDSISLPYFIKYCLPNAFWITSYILVVNALVQIDNHRLLWAITLPAISIVCEILQIWKIVPGTFDIGDLLCFIFPAIVYIVFYKNKYHETIP